MIEGIPVDTWMHRERPIFIEGANQVEDTRSKPMIGGLHVDSPGHAMIRSDAWKDSWKNSTIVVRSSRDRGAFGEIVAHDHFMIGGP